MTVAFVLLAYAACAGTLGARVLADPAAMAKLSPDEIDALIGACTFHEPKSRTIHEIARRTGAKAERVIHRQCQRCRYRSEIPRGRDIGRIHGEPEPRVHAGAIRRHDARDIGRVRIELACGD